MRGYGYQWWVPWRSAGESMALGAFGQMLWVDTEHSVSIAQFGAEGGDSAPDTSPEDVEDTHAAMRAIATAVTSSGARSSDKRRDRRDDAGDHSARSASP